MIAFPQVFLALVCAASIDAGEVDVPRAASVSHGLLVLDDGRLLTVDGGVWLSEALARQTLEHRARLEAENRALRDAPAGPPPWWFVLSVVLAAGAGVATGYFLPRP